MDADEVIAALGLRPHPEGGWFSETWREPAADTGRATSTAIYYLLRAGEESHWHRVDATEVWHFYAGDPLLLLTASDDAVPVTEHTMGTDLSAGHRPQLVVPAGTWQAARPLGAWTLVGCAVAPGFSFEGSELAPPDWSPRS